MIIFDNDGLIPLEAFSTFGMSAKPGSTNPLGKFGSGLKYGVAIVLRLGGEFTLWRGRTQYVFYTKIEEFRGKEFAKVRMKKRTGFTAPWRYESLPFTTELGKHWRPWMAVRELEANMRDEGGCSLHVEGAGEDSVALTLSPNRTIICVRCKEMEEAFKNIDDIFLPPKELVFENDEVKIYEGESNYIFYRGMRVTDLRKPSLYTYEMKHVQLTEDRTSQWAFLDNSRIKNALLTCPDQSVIEKIVKQSGHHHEESFDWDEKKQKVSSAWHGALSRGGLSPRFATMRDNLDYGLGKKEDVDVCLTVEEWESVLGYIGMDNRALSDNIREQMTEAGWKEDSSRPIPVNPNPEAPEEEEHWDIPF